MRFTVYADKRTFLYSKEIRIHFLFRSQRRFDPILTTAIREALLPIEICRETTNNSIATVVRHLSDCQK